MKLKNILIGLLSVMLVACDDFDEINTNPNATTQVTSGMLATGLIKGVTSYEAGAGKNFIRHHLLGKYLSWTEPQDIDIAFNLLGRSGFGLFPTITTAQKMVDSAPTEKLRDSYQGLYHFIKVFYFYDATMRMGDIPYSEALKGESDAIYTPVYDTQKEVMIGLLNELDEADRLFANGENFSGDIVCNGDVTKWRKVVNSFQLKILINLYKKEADTEINLKQRINSVLQRPLFESIDDNFQIIFSEKANQKYPYHKDQNSFTGNDRVSDIVIDKLKELGDYRLFHYAKPTLVAERENADPSSWDSYTGVDPTLPQEDIMIITAKGLISQLNDRYEELYDCEPLFYFSYQEQNFILAEMALRGFISGNAADYYTEGIHASMQFVAQNTPNNPKYHHNRQITDAYITDYLNSEAVKLKESFDEKLSQIIWQKYLTTFMQTPFNAFFEYRRTGYPEFPINPKSNRNTPNDKMPLRWMYPTSELNYNMENVSAAIQRQFGAEGDTYMGVMWILK